jgi:uncharacterized membrane-anchored protein YhcB (DUF1043 family)
MKVEKPYIPQKRDTTHYLDLISELKANQRFQVELNKQVALSKQMIWILSLPVIALYVGMIVAPVICLQKIKERKIKLSKTRQEMDVQEKQEKIYHRNILTLEADLDDMLRICNENFDQMLEMIQKLSQEGEDNNDAHVLLAKYREEPPTNKLDFLTLFLSMESAWIRLRK